MRVRGFIGRDVSVALAAVVAALLVAATAGARVDPSKMSIAAPRADLGVAALDARDPTLVNEDLAYRVTVTNRGPQRAARIKLVVNVTGVAGVSASRLSGAGSCGRPSPTRVVCAVAGLARTRTRTVTIVVRPTELGSTSLAAVVSSATRDHRPQNNRAVQRTRVLGVSTVQGRGVRSTRGDSGSPTVTTEINARLDPTAAGGVSGTFTLQYAAISASPARGSDLRGRVVCLNVEGMRAMAGGVVESSNNPAFPVGGGVRLAFTDNGDPGAGRDSTVAFVGIQGAPTCELAPPEQEELLIEGNYVVHHGEP